MNEYKVKQLYPAHADHISHYKQNFLNDLFKDKVVVQKKYDGERMLVHFNQNETYCTSRRISKKTGYFMENQDKIKNLPLLKDLNYTVIDCEFYADSWSEAVGILHSLPDRAYQLQETVTAKFAVFDCLFFDSIDLRDKSYDERITYVFKIIDLLHNQVNDYRFHFVEQFVVNNIESAYDIASEYWSAGYEGVVLKSLSKKYYDKAAMLKIKKTETIDVVVCDYQEGRGKYAGVVGALYVGFYNPKDRTIVKISKVNCGTDEDRKMWKQLFDKNEAIGKVIEVKCQEVTEKSLRHPVYLRLRNDKSMSMCTRNTIFK